MLGRTIEHINKQIKETKHVNDKIGLGCFCMLYWYVLQINNNNMDDCNYYKDADIVEWKR